MKKLLWILCVAAVSAPAVFGQSIARDPYNGAIVVDAANGKVLFEDGADRPGYPASMLKLMDLFVILDRVQQGNLRLDDMVPVTKEAMKMGGSQVWLDPRERFTVNELLYALMIQSANDAAMALAIHIGGSREGFVRMMNDKARQLGLSPVTQFQSPHGLPPGKGQRPDMTTPRDFAKLCLALLDAHPETLKYTSETKRVFRPEKPLIMETHNKLLGVVPGCDGLKTGWIAASGYCIAATAQRNGARVVVVVMGSATRPVRDAKAVELINRYLPEAARAAGPPPPLPAMQPPAPPLAPVVAAAQGEAAAAPEAEPAKNGGGWWKGAGLVLLGVFLASVVGLAVRRRLFLGR